MANDAAQEYRCFVATTTGYFAVETAVGELFVCRAGLPQDIPPSEAIALWSCAGFSDPRPSGDVTALDCHELGLTLLDVRRLAALQTLDCSDNQLTELDLDGLQSLENLYCDQNPLDALNLSPCPSLNFVGYASRHLGCSGTAIASLTSDMVCHDGPLFWFHPEDFNGVLNEANNSFCAERYNSPRTRPITREEAEVRDIAYALKRTDPAAIAVAAPAMAALIAGPCWLVPIPASDGNLNANLALARALAALVPGARVKLAISRSQPVESSAARRRRGLCGLQPEEHHFVRTAGPMEPLPLYFVDNVITTGNTIRAAHGVLGWVNRPTAMPVACLITGSAKLPNPHQPQCSPIEDRKAARSRACNSVPVVIDINHNPLRFAGPSIPDSHQDRGAAARRRAFPRREGCARQTQTRNRLPRYQLTHDTADTLRAVLFWLHEQKPRIYKRARWHLFYDLARRVADQLDENAQAKVSEIYAEDRQAVWQKSRDAQIVTGDGIGI